MNGHCNHLALKFSVCVKERQDRLPSIGTACTAVIYQVEESLISSSISKSSNDK